MGDALTEGIPRILATNFTGTTEALWAIFDDTKVYEFARRAVLNGLLIMVLHSKIPIEPIVEQVRMRLEKHIAARNVDLTTELVHFIMEARLTMLYDYAQQAFDRDLIDLFFFDQDWFNERSVLPPRLEYRYYQFMGSAFEELATWDSCRKSIPIALGGEYLGKLGRNDHCFCLSGKKYKKCCIGNYPLKS